MEIRAIRKVLRPLRSLNEMAMDLSNSGWMGTSRSICMSEYVYNRALSLSDNL